MSFEIERKFLLRNDDWQQSATSQMHIRQAYLACDGKASIRVRIRHMNGATLTIKSREPQLRRLELEYPIPTLEAEALLGLRQSALVEKVRHHVPVGDHTWEIDVFQGDNRGLVIAEVELQHEHERVELPSWIGAEVTGQRQYYNSALAQHPFRAWSPHTGAASTRQSP
jgi:adenylate cyclase